MQAAEQLFFEGTRQIAAHNYADAEDCFRRTVAIAPHLAEAHANLGWLLDEANAPEEADACYRRALALNASNPQILLNYGALLARMKRFCEAEAVYLNALQLNPQSAAAWSNLGVLCAQMARYAEAITCCVNSLLIDPDYAKAHINLAYLYLRQGRFEEGWAHLERRTWKYTPPPSVTCPRWRGGSLQGKSILIGHESGLGDMIHFARYAQVLRDQGARRITLVCPPALQRLLASMPGVDEVLSLDAALPTGNWDCWTSLMSLPFHCKTRLHGIPAALPYLHTDQQAAARWNALLPSARLRVGLVWQGNPKFENDDERSIASLDLLQPLGGIDGVTFISLQKGCGEAQAKNPPHGLDIVCLRDEIGDFADTTAIVANLDLVITVDTAVAHLVGAMGKPCWIMLPHHMPDWRWLSCRDDSPWYPGTVRLFRQPSRGDWATVLTQVRAALADFKPA
jgi:thioredoxin-like negative regulator of GroEL